MALNVEFYDGKILSVFVCIYLLSLFVCVKNVYVNVGFCWLVSECMVICVGFVWILMMGVYDQCW